MGDSSELDEAHMSRLPKGLAIAAFKHSLILTNTHGPTLIFITSPHFQAPAFAIAQFAVKQGAGSAAFIFRTENGFVK